MKTVQDRVSGEIVNTLCTKGATNGKHRSGTCISEKKYLQECMNRNPHWESVVDYGVNAFFRGNPCLTVVRMRIGDNDNSLRCTK